MGIIRKTLSIDLILNEINASSGALSVVELIKRLHEKINKTTIYRVLDKLEDDGVLHSFLDNGGLTWYAKCKGCSKSVHHDVHPHFQCISCGKVQCLETQIHIPEIPNYHISHSQILLQGVCKSCNS